MHSPATIHSKHKLTEGVCELLKDGASYVAVPATFKKTSDGTVL